MDYLARFSAQLEGISSSSSWILSSSSRLVRYLKTLDKLRNLSRLPHEGAHSWLPLAIEQTNHRLIELWKSLPLLPCFGHRGRPILLNQHQELVLWQRVISTWSSQPQHPLLLNRQSTGRHAAKAWRQLHAYCCLPPSLLLPLLSDFSPQTGVASGSQKPSSRAQEYEMHWQSLAATHLALDSRPARADFAANGATLLAEQGLELNTKEYLQACWQLLEAALAGESLDTVQAQWSHISLDCQAFLEWTFLFTQELVDNNWFTEASLPDLLSAIIKRYPEYLELPRKLYFAEPINDKKQALLTPQEIAWRHSLAQAGVELIDLPWQATPGDFFCLAKGREEGEALASLDPDSLSALFPTTADELYAAAAWARRELEAKPNQRLALVLPNLQPVLSLVCRIMDEVLCPKMLQPDQANAARPYNVSLGVALTSHAMISTALKLLSWFNGACPLAEVGPLLRSRYLSESREQAELAQLCSLEQLLCRTGLSSVSMQTVLDGIRARQDLLPAGEDPQDQAAWCRPLAKRLTLALEMKSRLAAAHLPTKRGFSPRKRSSIRSIRRYPSKWAKVFRRLLLKVFNWPAAFGIDSVEYQFECKFLKTIDELASLDHVCKRLTYAQTLSHLVSMAENIILRPKAQPAPLEIISVREALGQAFDQVWLAGFNAADWPPARQAANYLPRSLQSYLSMDGANPGRALAQANALTQGLMLLAPRGYLSYAANVPGSVATQELHASPLLRYLPRVQLAASPESVVPESELSSASYIQKLFAARCLEQVPSVPPPAVVACGPVSGGSTILSLQAKCPFSAFATIRLHAQPPEEVWETMHSTVRGSVTHKALELLWQQLKDSKTLHQLCPEGKVADSPLAEYVKRAALAAIRHFRRPDFSLYQQYMIPGGERFTELELQQVIKLMHRWLELEWHRPEPFKVLSVESQEKMELFGLRFRGIIDRIDVINPQPEHLPLGADSPEKELIIDYKTGSLKPDEAWFGHGRPTSPQLPIYLLHKLQQSRSGQVQGIAFAFVHRNKAELVGLTNGIESVKASGISQKFDSNDPQEYWKLCLEWFKTSLSALAQEFLQGEARVDPQKDACRYCKLSALCRYCEHGSIDTASDEEENSDSGIQASESKQN